MLHDEFHYERFYPINFWDSYSLSLELLCELSLIPKPTNRASLLSTYFDRGNTNFHCILNLLNRYSFT